MASREVAAANKRLMRFVSSHADELGGLTKREQNRAIDLAYNGQVKEASAYVAKINADKAVKRSEVSRRSAATRLANRRQEAIRMWVADLQRNRVPYSTVRIRRNALEWTVQDIREIERAGEYGVYAHFLSRARQKPKEGMTVNPFWYR
jgi:hypothetical protein